LTVNEKSAKDELGLRILDLAGCLERADGIVASMTSALRKEDDLGINLKISHNYNIGRIRRDLAGARDAVRLMEENHDA
jgi:hypothetical protein